MNVAQVKTKMKTQNAFFHNRIFSIAAILLMQANLALVVDGQQPQASPAGQQPVPESPAPTQNGSTAAPPTLAQQAQDAQQQAVAPQRPFHVDLPHSHKPLSQYRPSDAPPLDLTNSPRLQNLIRDGKLYISLHDAISLAIENNLDLAYFRYNFPIAQTDIARTRAGGAVQGVNTSIVQSSTQGGFGGGTSGGGGGAGGSAAAGAGGIVTSTLGAGTTVASFDPFLTFKGYVDHTVFIPTNPAQDGCTTCKQNQIQGQSNFSENFPLGTGVVVNYLSYRNANNSNYSIINPNLYSNLTVQVTQQFLAGFGVSTNERYMHIAKKNAQINDLAFRSQVIATVTQVENIYWDLVNAYRDELVKEQLVTFAQKTLSDDQKQLELNAIPAMQVTKDESDEATSEGDLTVARAALRLNELLMKNAITKMDEPAIADIPVIPLDRSGSADPNASKPTDDLIAEAEKNRPDVQEDEMAMQVAQMSLKSIRSELLPTLSTYGFYSGAGTAGPRNPNCVLGAECATTLPGGFGGMLANTFNYSSPEYQVGMTLQINLRNRVAKADQFRAVLEYRQRQINFEEQRKTIRFDVRNSQFALQQAEARVNSAQKARDLAQHTFEVTQQEQKLGAKSSSDTLLAQHDLGRRRVHAGRCSNSLRKVKGGYRPGNRKHVGPHRGLN